MSWFHFGLGKNSGLNKKGSIKDLRRRLSFEDAARTPKGRFMRMEPLEDRLLLATYAHVTNQSQLTDALSGSDDIICIDASFSSSIGFGCARNVTIQGNNNTITYTGGANARGLLVQGGATVNVTYLTMKNFNYTPAGDAGGGGAFYCLIGTLNLTGVTIDSCKSYKGGAVVCVGTVNMESCIVQNCTTTTAGGVVAVQSGATFHATNTYFIGNSATGHGGAIHYESGNSITSNLTNCHFRNNSCTGYGGAIRVESGTTIKLNGCEFTSCSAPSGWGGAIYNDKILDQCLNCTFTSCSAGEGGAVFNNGGTTFEGCVFTSCYAGNRGGAIFTNSSITVKTSIFNGNYTTSGASKNTTGAGSGGAIYIGATQTLTVDSSSFTNNSSKTAGGAIMLMTDTTNHKTANCNITNSFFGGNKCNGYVELVWYYNNSKKTHDLSGTAICAGGSTYSNTSTTWLMARILEYIGLCLCCQYRC